MTEFEHILHYNKGTSLLTKKKYDKAVISLKKSLAIYPTADAYLNLGTCYKYLDKDSSASECFRKAEITPEMANQNIPALANVNLGLMSYVYDDDDRAVKHFDKALELSPSNGDAAWNKATALLRQACSGDFSKFTEGWNYYEYRFKKSAPVTCKATNFGHLREHQWTGQRDIRLLVCAEQGIGDSIMFARYMPELEAKYGVQVTLQAEPSLGSLLWKNTVHVNFDPNKFDYMLPLGSICRFIGFVDSAPYVQFEDKYDLDGFNIGIVFSGNADHTNDRHRSVSVHRFKRFTKYGNLWSLNPSAKNLPKWVNPCEINTWEDTAKWLNSMDLVITVDTSLAHMSGAMGVRTWMIQPFKETDFRWGSNNNKENIWYSTVDVYRNPQDWEFVFNSLEEDLQ